MGLFKRAAARGIAHELVRQGVISFPSKEAMDEAADAVADSPIAAPMPELSPEGGHSPEELATVANKLMEIAHALMAEAGAVGGPPGADGSVPPPPNPEAAKVAFALVKTAAESDYETVASEEAVACMLKVSEEVKEAAGGGLMHGGDKGNDPVQAARHGEVAALDNKQRPPGMYHVGAGQTDMPTMQGHVGDISKHPTGPTNTPVGANSVSKDAGSAKAAGLDAELKKIANKLVGLHDGKDKNKLTDSVDSVAKLDVKNRPEGSYLVGVGNANFSEPQTHRIGVETPHPKAPHNSPKGTNSVIEASKTSEEDAFLVLFKKTAEDVGPYLPQMSDDEKVAAISRMIGYDHAARQEYLNQLHAQKKAEVSCEVEMKGDESKGKMSKKEDDKAEAKEKSEESAKKESALLSRIREIAASAS